MAEKASNNLARYYSEINAQLKESLNSIKNQLVTGLKSDDFTEIELTEWAKNTKNFERC